MEKEEFTKIKDSVTAYLNQHGNTVKLKKRFNASFPTIRNAKRKDRFEELTEKEKDVYRYAIALIREESAEFSQSTQLNY